MPKRFRFRETFKDEELNHVLRQVEDNFASSEDLDSKAIRTVNIDRSEPSLKSLKDGDECIYDDGTNPFLYRRAGGRLFKIQLTEV